MAGTLEIRTQVVVNEVEERGQVGESDLPGLGLAAACDGFQKRLDQVNCEFL